MKKLLFVVLAGLLVGVWALDKPAISPQTEPVKQASASASDQKPQSDIGSSQGGITLEAVYAPATPEIDKLSAPAGHILVTVRLKTDVPYQEFSNNSSVYTDDGNYIQPVGFPVKECPEGATAPCVTFIVPDNVLVDSFIYKDLRWYL